MTSRSVIAQALFVVCLCGSFPAHGLGLPQESEFFVEDILPETDDPAPYLYATFMQHATSSESSDYLHMGIDVAADAADPVFSANIAWGGDEYSKAQVAFANSDTKQMLIVRKNHAQTEAILLGHIEPAFWYGDEFDHSQWIGNVENLGDDSHVHVNVYRGFFARDIWETTSNNYAEHILLPAGSISPANLRSRLVNPATNAFGNMRDQGEWLYDDVEPTISQWGIHNVWELNSCRALVRAYDKNNNMDQPNCNYTSDCKTGVYKIKLIQDTRGTVGEVLFEKWNDDPDDFYADPEDPPNGTCNRDDELLYYLEVDEFPCPDTYFHVEVWDAAGNDKESDSEKPTAGDPWIPLECNVLDSQIHIRWKIWDHWVVRQFDLYRSSSENERGSRLNLAPIENPIEKEAGVLHYMYVDDLSLSDDWSTFHYVLAGRTDDGETRTFGSASVENPHRLGIAIEASPNPFADNVTLGFLNFSHGDVQVKIYNVSGRLVRDIVEARLPRGWVTYQWDGRNSAGESVPPGVYFAVVKRGNRTSVAKIALVR